MIDSHEPCPQNQDLYPSPDFSAWEGTHRWLGAPGAELEMPDPLSYFTAVPLVCEADAVWRDWSPQGLLDSGLPSGLMHVYGDEIVPSSVYHVQVIDSSFMGALDIEAYYSVPPLPIGTARWGDVTGAYQDPCRCKAGTENEGECCRVDADCGLPPSPGDCEYEGAVCFLSQPNFFDVSEVITKWNNTIVTAAITARADLDPAVTNQTLNMFDVSGVIDAVGSKAYPYPMPWDECPGDPAAPMR